jgi:hypothetical protein
MQENEGILQSATKRNNGLLQERSKEETKEGDVK